MQRTPLAAFALLVGALIGGCVGGDDEPTTPGPTTPIPSYRAFLPMDGVLGETPGTSDPVNSIVSGLIAPANELSIAVNPRDPLNLVAGAKDYYLGTDHPCPATAAGSAEYPINVWTAVFWSRDGGLTWSEALMPGHPEDSANATHANKAWPCNSDPVVVFGEDGTAYYSGLGIRGDNVPDPTHPCVHQGTSIWLMKSDDGGATWGDFSCVVAGSYAPQVGGVNVDKQWFAVDGQNVYFTYMAFNPSDFDLMFRRSTDGGRTWDPERTLFQFPSGSAPTGFQATEQFSMPQVGPDGAVHVIFRSFGANGGVYYTRSMDEGVTFVTPRKIADIDPIPGNFGQGLYRTDSYPVLAVDAGTGNHSGNLYITWSDEALGDPDVVLIQSTDGGATWSDPVRLNNDTVGNLAVQFLPWVATSPNGDVHVLWLDNRSSGNATRLDAYYRVSRDGGETWDPELRVNAQTIETAACHHQSGANFIGDYIAIAAGDEAVHPFWPDGASGSCRGTTATLLREPSP